MSDYKPRHGAVNHGPRYLLMAALALLVVLFAWLLLEPHMLQTERVTIQSSRLPQDIGQLRVVFVSDLHTGTFPCFSQRDAQRLVQSINAERPDFILLGGDYASNPENAAELFRTLPKLRATYGCFAVLGENDRELSGTALPKLREAMSASGIQLLMNDAVKIHIGAQQVIIAGIDDAAHGVPDLAGVALKCRQEDFVILLAHNPSLAAQALDAANQSGSKTWFELGLFGHTHGGQISFLSALPGLPHASGAYQSGWYHPNRSNLLVSRGVGTSLLPMRFMCRPQIHVITIKAAPA